MIGGKGNSVAEKGDISDFVLKWGDFHPWRASFCSRKYTIKTDTRMHWNRFGVCRRHLPLNQKYLFSKS